MIKSIIRSILVFFVTFSGYFDSKVDKIKEELLANHLSMGWDYQFSFDCQRLDFLLKLNILLHTFFKSWFIFLTIKFNKYR